MTATTHPPKRLHDLAEAMDELMRVRNYARALAMDLLDDDPQTYAQEILRHDAKVLLDRIKHADEILDACRA